MKIYKLICNWDGFALPYVKNEKQRFSFYTIKDFKKIKGAIDLEIRNNKGEDYLLGSISSTGRDFPICINSDCYSLLKNSLTKCGVLKLAEVDGKSNSYYVFWPTKVLNCLDVKESEVFTTASGYQRLVKPVFNTNKIPEESIFIVSQFKNNNLFITEDIAEILTNSDLTGYILEEV